MRALPTTSILHSRALTKTSNTFIAAGSRNSTPIASKPTARNSAALTAEQQDETVAALQQGKAAEFVWPAAQAFFTTVRTHTMEGMFADPVYGGNKNFVGWRLIGFPGAQPLYTPEDMKSTQAFTREPIIGLQSRAKEG